MDVCANTTAFKSHEKPLDANVPVDVFAEETEETACFRGSGKSKVRDTSVRTWTSWDAHGGNALNDPNVSPKSLGAGCKSVNSTTGDAPGKLVTAMDMYRTCSRNWTGSADYTKELKKAETEPRKTTLLEEGNDPRYCPASYGCDTRSVCMILYREYRRS